MKSIVWISYYFLIYHTIATIFTLFFSQVQHPYHEPH